MNTSLSTAPPERPRSEPPVSPLAARRPVNARSVLLGLAGVVLVSGLTAYNDHAVFNTALIGSHMPLVVVAFFTAFGVLVNAPLRRVAPRVALGSHELAVALGMMLVACALPNIGLFRYLPGHLTGFFNTSANNGEHAAIMRQLDLPDWLFPTMTTADRDPAARGNDPVVREFVTRAPLVEPTFTARFAAVPWGAWARPALVWAAFLACLYGAILCMSVIFRRQWVENERLPFPLAGIYLALIEEPPPGRALSPQLRSWGFWLAAAAVFAVHALNGLHEYAPRMWPEVPLRFDFNPILAEAPWRYAEPAFKSARVMFIVVGIMYFVQTKITFSIWFFFLALQAARMTAGGYQTDVTGPMLLDQMVGAMVAFLAAILWVARHHLAAVAAQMVRPPRPDEPRGRYLPYPAAAWGLVACFGGMAAWLTLAGTTVIGGLVLAAMMLAVLLVVARVVAEVGLPFVLFTFQANRPWLYVLADLPAALATRTTLRTYFFNQWMSGMFLHDTRETLSVYATHALRVADERAYAGERNWRRAVPFTLALVLAIAVAYLVAGGSMLYVEYNHATTLDRSQAAPINNWGAHGMPAWFVLNPMRQYVPPAEGPPEPHARLGHFAFGAATTAALAVLRLRLAWWPLHPVGFLLMATWGAQQGWFSILIGWLAKATIVRFGGATLFHRARPVFLGLIIGEAGAAAFWLVVALARLALGLDYYAIRILPV